MAISRQSVFAAFGVAVFIFGVLAVLSLVADSSGEIIGFHEKIDPAGNRLTGHLGQLTRRLEALEARAGEAKIPSELAPREKSVDTATAEGSGDGDGADKATAMLGRLDDLSRRVEVLEEDPLLTGFRYVDSDNPALRRRGIRALKKIARHDPEARQVIRELLGDPDKRVRLEAVNTLRDIKDADAIPQLLRLLGDPEADLRRAATRSLVDLKAPGSEAAIARLLSDSSRKVRQQAAGALGRLKSRTGVQPLIGALRDAHPEVRREAMIALGKLGDPSAVPALRELRANSEQGGSFRLIKVLRKLGDPQAFQEEVGRLSHTALTDANEAARLKAVRTLEKHARKESTDVFTAALEDASPRVRKNARKALEKK